MLASNEMYERWLRTDSDRADMNDQNTRKSLEAMGLVMIRDTTIKNKTLPIGHKNLGGFSFKVYQPWYIALPIGMIHDISIKIDDECIDRESIFILDKGGQRIMMINARSIHDIWWNIVEPLEIFVARKEEILKGEHPFEIILAQQITKYYGLPMNMLMSRRQCIMTVE